MTYPPLARSAHRLTSPVTEEFGDRYTEAVRVSEEDMTLSTEDKVSPTPHDASSATTSFNTSGKFNPPTLGAPRRRPRLPLHRPVQVSTSQGVVIAELIDIGEDGLRLRSSRPLDVDDEVRLHVFLPAVTGSVAARHCDLDARVVWRAGLVVGLLYTDPIRTRPRVRKLLQREVTSRSSLSE